MFWSALFFFPLGATCLLLTLSLLPKVSIWNRGLGATPGSPEANEAQKFREKYVKTLRVLLVLTICFSVLGVLILIFGACAVISDFV